MRPTNLSETFCHAIEIEPRYVDVAVRRWQAFTGEQASPRASSC